MIRSILLALALGLVWLTAPAYSQAQSLQRNDPNRPTARIAADLGVTQEQFVACFWDVNPATDHAPSGATQRANKAVLLPCLQQANPAITNTMLDGVMDSYRPEGPMH